METFSIIETPDNSFILSFSDYDEKNKSNDAFLPFNDIFSVIKYKESEKKIKLKFDYHYGHIIKFSEMEKLSTFSSNEENPFFQIKELMNENDLSEDIIHILVFGYQFFILIPIHLIEDELALKLGNISTRDLTDKFKFIVKNEEMKKDFGIDIDEIESKINIKNSLKEVLQDIFKDYKLNIKTVKNKVGGL